MSTDSFYPLASISMVDAWNIIDLSGELNGSIPCGPLLKGSGMVGSCLPTISLLLTCSLLPSLSPPALTPPPHLCGHTPHTLIPTPCSQNFLYPPSTRGLELLLSLTLNPCSTRSRTLTLNSWAIIPSGLTIHSPFVPLSLLWFASTAEHSPYNL